MTALPEPVSWTRAGTGAVDAQLPARRVAARGGDAAVRAPGCCRCWRTATSTACTPRVGVRVPFRYALVNGWYYNATPIPSPRLLARVLWQGRGRAVKVVCTTR